MSNGWRIGSTGGGGGGGDPSILLPILQEISGTLDNIWLQYKCPEVWVDGFEGDTMICETEGEIKFNYIESYMCPQFPKVLIDSLVEV
jgi:hypothetical protein